MVGQSRQAFNEGGQGIGVVAQLPTGLVDDGPETLFATDLEYLPKLGIHVTALILTKCQPGRE